MTPPGGPAPAPVTNQRQLERYQRRVQLCVYLTGGLGGIALFAAADNVFLTTTHPVMGAVLLTIGLVAGGALGLAYSGYQWDATRLRRRIEDGVTPAGDGYERSAYPPSQWSERFYRTGSLLVALTGAWLVAAAWISVAAGSATPAGPARCDDRSAASHRPGPVNGDPRPAARCR